LETVAFLKTHPSHANYFLCEVVDQFSATELARLLLSRYGFLIKDLTGKEGFEQGQFIRVAVRNKADNWRFVEALRDLC
jgi:histidinol-phosphate/aromatic aminotransferase/cobyric acid decarboxylase-like protein